MTAASSDRLDRVLAKLAAADGEVVLGRPYGVSGFGWLSRIGLASGAWLARWRGLPPGALRQ
jgi:hypothetical protein